MVTLRPYQEEALEAIKKDLAKNRFALLQAATGAGKTIIFSQLIKSWLIKCPSLRIGVIAHRKELIKQAYEKLTKVWPEGFHKVGIACAGITATNTAPPIVIGSVQTLARRKLRRPFHLLIIDEVHRLPPIGSVNKNNQYHKLIKRLMKLYPALRILGVTATPFRLGHGYIYGDNHKKGRKNFFPFLSYQISLDALIEKNFLVPIRAKEAEDVSEELRSVRITAGDYNGLALSKIMIKKVHIESTINAYIKYGEERQHVLIFACSIEHAELLEKAFQERGFTASVIHSEMSGNRDTILRNFNQGKIKFLINVGILVEGWDSPIIDLIILCRPTKSPALFVQMVGRGTRTSKNKKDCLVLDLANNFKTHGHPSNPLVKTNKGGIEETTAPLQKVCPVCSTLSHIATYICYYCQHAFIIEQLVDYNKPLIMHDVVSKKEIKKFSKVLSWNASKHLSYKNNLLFRLDFECKPGGTISLYLDFQGEISIFQQSKARTIWIDFTKGATAPLTVDEAMGRKKELINIPTKVYLENNGRYKNIKSW